MPRNKYPEQTVERILECAARLFAQNGYEKTTLQDIIEETHLSKGAVYHHFSSKEEILMRVAEQIGEQNAAPIRAIRDDATMNGLQKLKAVFRVSLENTRQTKMLSMLPCLAEQPRFLAIQVQSLYQEVAPEYIAPIIRQGMEDGSIQTSDPVALAEALLFLSDLWLSPALRRATPQQMRARCAVFRQITGAIGLELLDDTLEELLVAYCR